MLDKSEYRRRFPRLCLPRDLDPFEAMDRGLTLDRTWWLYMADVWGEIVIPEGFITDFASVPRALQGARPNDHPYYLRPSAPHDFLFTQRADGTRGWHSDGIRRLSLAQVNAVMREAMLVCGASHAEAELVYAALCIANLGIAHEFAQ